MNEFSDNIKYFLKKNKMTQAKLSEISGIPLTSLRGYIKGDHLPTIYVACDIAEALGVSINDLCYANNNKFE